MVDLIGQHYSDRLAFFGSLAGAIAAFAYGAVARSASAAFWCYVATIGILLVLNVPNWPFWNRHPQSWLPSIDARKGETAALLAAVKQKQR
jgi:signal peptidase complex subunit 1